MDLTRNFPNPIFILGPWQAIDQGDSLMMIYALCKANQSVAPSHDLARAPYPVSFLGQDLLSPEVFNRGTVADTTYFSLDDAGPYLRTTCETLLVHSFGATKAANVGGLV